MAQENAVQLNATGRIAAIDQLRGYAIFGMFFVNYFGFFELSHEQFKHHVLFLPMQILSRPFSYLWWAWGCGFPCCAARKRLA